MPAETDLLLVTDVQNDFCPGGALAVPNGNAVVPAINRIGRRFAHIVLSQDWHPPGHVSFASSHPGRVPFETVSLDYGAQTLWPDHCVQGSWGAAFHPGLDLPHAELVIRKGFRQRLDSYSAFFENDHRTPTGLAGYLRERGFRRLHIVGLATDYCVAWTAIDAAQAGFEVSVILEACAAIDVNASLPAALSAMRQAGVRILSGDRTASSA